MKFATEVKTYNFCIPHDADANQTFTFQYEYLVHKTSGGTRYVYVENETRINELNETLQEMNETSSKYKYLYKYYLDLFRNLTKKYVKLIKENDVLKSEKETYWKIINKLKEEYSEKNLTEKQIEDVLKTIDRIKLEKEVYKFVALTFFIMLVAIVIAFKLK